MANTVRSILGCMAAASTVWLTVADAQQPPDSARRFVEILRYGDQSEGITKECIANGINIPPESLLKAEPDKFYGIRPGSTLWPQVVEAYRDYYKRLCSRPTRDEFLDALANTYRQSMTVEELDQAIAFYSTAVGQRLVAANTLASKAASELYGRANANHSADALAAFDRRLQAISGEKQTRK
jgi:hypothetical protein